MTGTYLRPRGRDGDPLCGPRVVFVSYCREDAEWMRRFGVMLKPEVRNRGVELWSDEHIRPGSDWSTELADAIARAEVALLLVSPGFLGCR